MYYLVAFVAGAILGAVVGFLFGARHGKRIKEGGQALKDTLGKI